MVCSIDSAVYTRLNSVSGGNSIIRLIEWIRFTILTEHRANAVGYCVGYGSVRQGVKAGAKRTSTRAGTDQVLENHVPSDYEGDHFAYRDVAVDVGAT